MRQARQPIEEVFNKFRATRTQGSKTAFSALQDSVAQNAGLLIENGLSSFKEIIEILLKLDQAADERGNAKEGNQTKLQEFLRGDSKENEATAVKKKERKATLQ